MLRTPPFSAAFLAAALFMVPTAAPGQDAGPGTGGAVAALRAEKMLDGGGRRVLMIGAHPDDEYTDLIALLSRGDGVETAYLSLTRGEGGQNLIGNELGVGLGILRTDELLAARAIDGGRQFFTRAFDFGFSKSAEETFRFWPHDSLLKDVVRVIRQFQPQVIVSVWSGTPRDGHGHHTVAGIIAREAFDAAADPARFPEAGAAFRVSKFYLAPYTLQPNTPTLTLDGGRIEPASGLTMHQLAARSRSRHRSQDMGMLEEPGPWPVRVALAAVAPGVTAGPLDSMFAGIAISPSNAASAQRATGVRGSGIVLDAYADRDEIASGDSITITMLVVNNSPDTVAVRMRAGEPWWKLIRADTACMGTVSVAPGARRDCRVRRIADAVSQPYMLNRPLSGAMYDLPDAIPRTVATGDTVLSLVEPVVFGRAYDEEPKAMFFFMGRRPSASIATVTVRGRSLDQGLGELRRPIAVVPPIGVEITPGTTVWPRGVRSRTFEVHAEHLARGTTRARIALTGPAGWQVTPARDVNFSRFGERITLPFTITAPTVVRDTTVEFQAFAVIGNDTLRRTVHRIEYPHVPRRVYFTDANATVTVADMTFPSLARTAYVRGAADQIPGALHGAGIKLRVLDGDAMETAVLDSLSVLVIGPRAYEVSDAVRRAHPRIMEWVERGGTLVVQYQQYQYVSGGFAPRPFTIASPHDRVTDETAAVTLLDPAHRLLRFPNRITAADFDGWRQERGLYFAGTWDAAWSPLMEMHDAGEPPKRGGLLVANAGRGRVVYTGLAFFRQIPAGVPGAWRLFANLLAPGEARAR